MDSATPELFATQEPARTLEVKAQLGEMIKPTELIDIIGIGELTLSARKLYNILLEYAFGEDLGKEGHEWMIPLAELRRKHKGNERIEDDIIALMRTVVVVKLKDGGTRRVQLLGGNDLGEGARQRGLLTYCFDPKLVELLRDSTIYGRLEKEVLLAFTSKYALSLYEAAARRVNLSHKCIEEFSVEEFRDLLGVELGKLARFANLNHRAIKPAVIEVNGLAPFNLDVQPRKQGNRVIGITMAWWAKTIDEKKTAYAELNRSRVGRSARLNGTVETLSEVP